MDDDKNLPNFMRPNKGKEPQECKDAAMWQKHLAIAHYGLIAFGIIIGVFMEQFIAGILFLIAAWVIYFVSIKLATRHAKWHLENNQEGKHIK